MSSRPPSPPGLPVIDHTLSYARDPFAFVDRVVDDVGDIVGASVLGVGEFYVLAHPDYIEQVLVSDPDAFDKGNSFSVAFGESIISVEGAQWERQREAMAEFFYPARIRSYAETMVELTEDRIDRWAGERRLSIRDEMTAVALENLFGTLFDRRLDVDGDEEIRRAAGSLNDWFEPSSWALPTWLPTPARRRFKRGKATLEAEARRLLAERKRDGAERGADLLSTLVALREAGDADLTDEEIVDQVTGFIFAGHETTALSLTFALHCLGTNPDVRERFHEELDDVLGGDAPTLSDVGDLEVTERIVLEAMRRYPAVHTIPRETTRSVAVGGYRLPPSSQVHLSIYSVHRDDRFWDDPESFRPERWRDTSPQEKGHAYAPFGAGPRACLGRRFAMLEATLVLATIGQRFRLDPLEELAIEPTMTTHPVGDVPATVHER